MNILFEKSSQLDVLRERLLPFGENQLVIGWNQSQSTCSRQIQFVKVLSDGNVKIVHDVGGEQVQKHFCQLFTRAHSANVSIKSERWEETSEKHSTRWSAEFTFYPTETGWSEDARRTSHQRQQSAVDWKSAGDPKSSRPCGRHSTAAEPSYRGLLLIVFRINSLSFHSPLCFGGCDSRRGSCFAWDFHAGCRMARPFSSVDSQPLKLSDNSSARCRRVWIARSGHSSSFRRKFSPAHRGASQSTTWTSAECRVLCPTMHRRCQPRDNWVACESNSSPARRFSPLGHVSQAKTSSEWNRAAHCPTFARIRQRFHRTLDVSLLFPLRGNSCSSCWWGETWRCEVKQFHATRDMLRLKDSNLPQNGKKVCTGTHANELDALFLEMLQVFPRLVVPLICNAEHKVIGYVADCVHEDVRRVDLLGRELGELSDANVDSLYDSVLHDFAFDAKFHHAKLAQPLLHETALILPEGALGAYQTWFTITDDIENDMNSMAQPHRSH